MVQFPLIVTGFGTANVNIFDVQTFLPLKVEANGGTLEFKQAIPVYGLPQIEIADTGNSVLKFDSAFDNSLNHAPHYVPISWDGASGQLDVSAITGSNLSALDSMYLNDFRMGDSIKLGTGNSVSLDSTGSILTVYQNGTSVGALDFGNNPDSPYKSYIGWTFSIDATTHTITGWKPPPPSVTISESVSGATNQTTDTISVSANAMGAGNFVYAVEIVDGNHNNPLGAANFNSTTGLWTLTASSLAAGDHSFTAQVTDAAGNQTTTGAVTLSVDIQPPTATIAESVSGAINQTSDTISVSASAVGTGNSIAQVEILDGITKLGKASFDNTTGIWTLTASSLALGDHSFTAQVTDAVGNQTTTSAVTLSVDTQPPTATISESIFGATNQTSDTISVSAQAQGSNNTIANVEILDGTTDLGKASFDNTTGLWTLTASSLAAGDHAFTAQVTDAAGNQTTTSAVTLSVDTQPPSATISESVSGATNQTSDTISVSAQAQGTNNTIANVEILDGITNLGKASFDNTTGLWTLTASSLAAGAHSFTAQVTDAVGNQTTTSAVTLSVDTQPPSATISESVSGVTNQTSDTISVSANAMGTGNSIANVEIFDGTTDLGAASVSKNTGLWTLTASSLAAGDHSFTAQVTDAAR